MKHAVIFLNFPPRISRRIGRGKQEQLKYATFSAATYFPNKIAYLSAHGFPGWTLDQSLSTNDTFTFVNHATREVVIAYRGTQWTNIGDLWQNLGILTNNPLLQQRAQHNLKLYRSTVTKYPRYDIVLTGHSAGGFQATYVAVRTGAKAVVFNSAATPNKTPMDMLAEMKGDIQHYSTTDLSKGVVDLASIFNTNPTETVSMKPEHEDDPHTIHHFTPETSPETAEPTAPIVTGTGRRRGRGRHRRMFGAKMVSAR